MFCLRISLFESSSAEDDSAGAVVVDEGDDGVVGGEVGVESFAASLDGELPLAASGLVGGGVGGTAGAIGFSLGRNAELMSPIPTKKSSESHL